MGVTQSNMTLSLNFSKGDLSMKKLLLILTGVCITVIALAGVGFASAQGDTPPNPQNPGGFGPRGGRFDGMDDSPLHDVMSAAIADALGLSIEELEAMHENGESLWALAEGQGLTMEELQLKMTEARENAFQQAVDEGLISQEQAEQMLNRQKNTRNGELGRGQAPRAEGKLGAKGFGGIDTSPLHEVMSAAIADAFGLSIEELEVMHKNGESLWALAEGQGLTMEEFKSKMAEVRVNTFQQAVDEGLISQEQAEQMHNGQKNPGAGIRTPGQRHSQGGEFSPRGGLGGRRGGSK